MLIQEKFAKNVAAIIKTDESIAGLAVGGSWLTHDMDAFSDLDLILVTKENLEGNKHRMLEYAKRFGHLLSGFTGEHVGEPRLLICLYDKPLLHVDIKFLTLDELQHRVETPVVLHDPSGQLKSVMEATAASYPQPDYQWIEDRFWTWVHYALLKIGRGEYMEAFDFFGFLRLVVLGPLLQVKNGNPPRGVRKVEAQLPPAELQQLMATLPAFTPPGLLDALQQAVNLYRHLRQALFPASVMRQHAAEARVMQYFEEVTTGSFAQPA